MFTVRYCTVNCTYSRREYCMEEVFRFRHKHISVRLTVNVTDFIYTERLGTRELYGSIC